MVACCRLLIGCALLATIASTLRVYPHQLAYFNEAAGGPENGYKHLLGSNFDWGQDLLLVRQWVCAKHERRKQVRLAFGPSYPASPLLHVPNGPDHALNAVNALASAEYLDDFVDEKSEMRPQDIVQRFGYTIWLIPIARHALPHPTNEP